MTPLTPEQARQMLAQGAVRYDGPPPRPTGAPADHHMPIDAGPPSLAPDLSWG